MNSIHSYLKNFNKIIVFIALFVLCPATTAFSEGLDIHWVEGPNTVTLGDDIAELTFGENYLFADGDDTRKAMESIGNPPSDQEVGMIIPKTGDVEWFVVFEYFPSGYIRDEDRDKLDADAILETMKKGTEESNEYRKKRGIPPIHLTGWDQEPYYDALTNNLTWTTVLVSEGDEEGHEGVNHNIRLLGRYGYMSVILVADRSLFTSFKPEIDNLVSNFSFKKGKSYAEYVKGDKVAKYGLTALIAGGAATVAAKTGIFKMLAKFGKVIVLAIIGFFAAMRNKIKNLFSGSGKTPSSDSIDSVTEPEEAQAAAQTDAKPSFMDNLENLRADGRIEDAIILIRGETRGQIDDPKLSGIYYDLLKESQQVSEWLKYASTHLDILVNENLKSEACNVYRECISQSPKFITPPKTLLKIAQFLVQEGNAKEGYEACAHFTKIHPNHPLLPEAYFLSAKILNEKLDNNAQAKKIVAGLIQKYPEHKRMSEFTNYLEKLGST